MNMFRGVVVAAALMSAPAMAAELTVDPRIAGPLVAALKAQITFQEAAMRAMGEDQAKRERDWAGYSAPLWRPPPDAKDKELRQ